MNELLLSDDEIDLIWHLPYLTQHDRLKAIARAQLENVLEARFFANRQEAVRPLSPAVVAVAAS
jgi:hypothetical protein